MHRCILDTTSIRQVPFSRGCLLRLHVVLPCVLVPGAVKSRHWVAASLVLCRHGSQTPDSQSAYNLNSGHPTRQIMMDLISGTITKPDAYRKQNIVVIRSVASQALERSFNRVPNRRGAAAHDIRSMVKDCTNDALPTSVWRGKSCVGTPVVRPKIEGMSSHQSPHEIHRHGAASAMDLPPLAIPTRTVPHHLYSVPSHTHTPYPIPMSLLPPSSCIRYTTTDGFAYSRTYSFHSSVALPVTTYTTLSHRKAKLMLKNDTFAARPAFRARTQRLAVSRCRSNQGVVNTPNPTLPSLPTYSPSTSFCAKVSLLSSPITVITTLPCSLCTPWCAVVCTSIGL